jgi:hypothetical protein
MVLLISLGMTTLPRSSILLTIPVAFIYKNLLVTVIGVECGAPSFDICTNVLHAPRKWVMLVSAKEWDLYRMDLHFFHTDLLLTIRYAHW